MSYNDFNPKVKTMITSFSRLITDIFYLMLYVSKLLPDFADINFYGRLVFIAIPEELMEHLQIILYVIAGSAALICLLTLFFSFFLTSAVIRPPIRSHQTAL